MIDDINVIDKQEAAGVNTITATTRTIRETSDTTLRLFETKKVAVYARVSRESEVKHHSIEAQKQYLKEYINQHPFWDFAGYYVDEGVTGTKLDRPALNRMIDDAKEGKIDIILTKSVSRLGRNTSAVLKLLQELKEMDVTVVFDTEHISTADPEGMFYLQSQCIMAEATSKQNSDYQKWAIRNRFKEGIPSYFRIYGYKMIDHQLYIVPEEAEVIKRIFDMYLSGMGHESIARQLTNEGIPSPENNRWRRLAVFRILTNERYTGDLLLQKWYRENHISKKTKRNKGDLPQYLIVDAHEAIISKEVFEATQAEIERRAKKVKKTVTKAKVTGTGNPKADQPRLFTRLIHCGVCGGMYKYKYLTMRSNNREVWICRNYFELGKEYCETKAIPENILIRTTLEVLLEQKLIKGCISDSQLTSKLIHKHIQKIIAYANQTLEYHLKNGEIVTKEWRFDSRSKSWTPEMRQRARERTLAQQAKRKEVGCHE